MCTEKKIARKEYFAPNKNICTTKQQMPNSYITMFKYFKIKIGCLWFYCLFKKRSLFLYIGTQTKEVFGAVQKRCSTCSCHHTHHFHSGQIPGRRERHCHSVPGSLSTGQSVRWLKESLRRCRVSRPTRLLCRGICPGADGSRQTWFKYCGTCSLEEVYSKFANNSSG